jgi:hypothetical protein
MQCTEQEPTGCQEEQRGEWVIASATVLLQQWTHLHFHFRLRSSSKGHSRSPQGVPLVALLLKRPFRESNCTLQH